MKRTLTTTPFRVCGRGSKQLSKAVEKSNEEKGLTNQEILWVYCSGSYPCYAKVISTSISDNVIIQPLFPVENDLTLYTLSPGHLWMAKKDKIHPIKVFIFSFFSIIYDIICR